MNKSFFITTFVILCISALLPALSPTLAASDVFPNPKPAPVQPPQEEPSCAPDATFGCFEVGLPGSSTFKAGQEISSFTYESSSPIKDLINLFVTFATAILVIIGVITIVIGGYLYMTAAGNASQVASAKEMITAALIGIFIAFVSVVILNTVNPFLGSKAVEPSLGPVESSAPSN